MKSRRTFTRKDIFIIFVCIVFLLMNIGAIGGSGRRRAKEMICLSNLQEWGTIFKMFTQDNNDYFLSGIGGGSGRWWIEPLLTYHQSNKLRLCPDATKPPDFGLAHFSYQAWKTGDYIGSYGLNGWICNPPPGVNSVWGRMLVQYYWRTPNVTGAGNIPVFLDMWWVDAWPRYTDLPSEHEFGPPDRVNRDEIQRACVNRHNGAINGLFMDFSARKVGLKELWTLKWHRQFNTNGPWTKAGGVVTLDWPQWMRNFKDY